MANVDFEFDFTNALAKAYHNDDTYQKISYIAKCLDMRHEKHQYREYYP